MRPAFLPALIAFVAPCAFLSGCSLLGGEEKSTLNEVDVLLSSIETVQVESTVSKERSRAALELLETLARPDFAGNAPQTYSSFVAAIDASEKQAAKLSESVGAAASRRFSALPSALRPISASHSATRACARRATCAWRRRARATRLC